jgi:acyl carrier protein
LSGVKLSAETALVSAGWLDSFAVVSLIAALEEALGIDIDVTKLELADFETPASIARLCARIRGD